MSGEEADGGYATHVLEGEGQEQRAGHEGFMGSGSEHYNPAQEQHQQQQSQTGNSDNNSNDIQHQQPNAPTLNNANDTHAPNDDDNELDDSDHDHEPEPHSHLDLSQSERGSSHVPSNAGKSAAGGRKGARSVSTSSKKKKDEEPELVLLDPEDGHLLRGESRGRKKDDTLPPSRARDVQRAFRARRAAHLAKLEDRILELEDENNRLRGLLNLPLIYRDNLGSGPTGRGKSLKEGGIPMTERVKAKKERDRLRAKLAAQENGEVPPDDEEVDRAHGHESVGDMSDSRAGSMDFAGLDMDMNMGMGGMEMDMEHAGAAAAGTSAAGGDMDAKKGKKKRGRAEITVTPESSTGLSLRSPSFSLQTPATANSYSTTPQTAFGNPSSAGLNNDTQNSILNLLARPNTTANSNAYSNALGNTPITQNAQAQQAQPDLQKLYQQVNAISHNLNLTSASPANQGWNNNMGMGGQGNGNNNNNNAQNNYGMNQNQQANAAAAMPNIPELLSLLATFHTQAQAQQQAGRNAFIPQPNPEPVHSPYASIPPNLTLPMPFPNNNAFPPGSSFNPGHPESSNSHNSNNNNNSNNMYTFGGGNMGRSGSGSDHAWPGQASNDDLYASLAGGSHPNSLAQFDSPVQQAQKPYDPNQQPHLTPTLPNQGRKSSSGRSSMVTPMRSPGTMGPPPAKPPSSGSSAALVRAKDADQGKAVGPAEKTAAEPDLLHRLRHCCHLTDHHVATDPGLLLFASRLCLAVVCPFGGNHGDKDRLNDDTASKRRRIEYLDDGLEENENPEAYTTLEPAWLALRSHLDPPAEDNMGIPGLDAGRDGQNEIATGRLAAEMILRGARNKMQSGQGGEAGSKLGHWIGCRRKRGMVIEKGLIEALTAAF